MSGDRKTYPATRLLGFLLRIPFKDQRESVGHNKSASSIPSECAVICLGILFELWDASSVETLAPPPTTTATVSSGPDVSHHAFSVIQDDVPYPFTNLNFQDVSWTSLSSP